MLPSTFCLLVYIPLALFLPSLLIHFFPTGIWSSQSWRGWPWWARRRWARLRGKYWFHLEGLFGDWRNLCLLSHGNWFALFGTVYSGGEQNRTLVKEEGEGKDLCVLIYSHLDSQLLLTFVFLPSPILTFPLLFCCRGQEKEHQLMNMAPTITAMKPTCTTPVTFLANVNYL